MPVVAFGDLERSCWRFYGPVQLAVAKRGRRQALIVAISIEFLLEMETVGMPRSREQVILNFHGIGTPNPCVPNDEIPYWVSEQQFIDIVDNVVELRMQGHDIRFTFDDGNKTDVSVGAPILASRKLRAEFFILTGRLNGDRYVVARDIEVLVDMGMSVGLHGKDHVDWRALDPSALHTETGAARAMLEEITGLPVAAVSIPFGLYNRRVITHLKSLEFQNIYTSDGGTTNPNVQVKARTSLRSDMTKESIRDILEGRQSLKTQIRRALSMTYRQKIA